MRLKHMTIPLLATCAGLLLLSALFAFLFCRVRSANKRLGGDLERFRGIVDVEQHAAAQSAKAEAALAKLAQSQAELLQLGEKLAEQRTAIAGQDSQIAIQQEKLSNVTHMLGEYQTLGDISRQIDALKETANQYNKVIGNFKTAGDLKAHITLQHGKIEELKHTIGEFATISDLNREVDIRRATVNTLEARIRELKEVLGGADTATALHERVQSQQRLLADLQTKVGQVEEALEMQEFGFYRARYDFESSSKYQEKLDRVREMQTEMVKTDQAIKWEKKWMVEDSEAKGRKMMAEQTKLMLRAFNGECDAAVAKVKYSNADTMETRIRRSQEQINKLGKTNASAIVNDYLELKLQELYLVHEHRIKQQQEKEEQQRIREEMREEEKARRDFEEAEEKAAKDESNAEKALDRARKMLEEATRGQIAATEETKAQNSLLSAQVTKLEKELADAIDRKAKAIARAQLTKSGYVYVLSNVGSFGENCYKLGLTRRLDPLDRVKELGDASVPFPFDVHAILYSEDAPSLENTLHRQFADRRVNLVNHRREYFRVTLEEIIAAVSTHFGEVTFLKSPEAAEYRESLAKRKAVGIPPVPLAGDSVEKEMPKAWGPKKDHCSENTVASGIPKRL